MADSSDGAKAPKAADVEALIAALAHQQPGVRQEAREALVAIGRVAVAALVKLLTHPTAHVRWEAAKTLGLIGDPEAAAALVARLEDKEHDVRWLAAEGLIVLEHQALRPLLEALIDRPESTYLQQGAHHVLSTLQRKHALEAVAPILAAMKEQEPEVAIPPAVYAVLNALETPPKTKSE